MPLPTPNPNNPFDYNREDLEISPYAKILADSTNPYAMYNNADRLGNMPYRYYTLGKFGHRIPAADHPLTNTFNPVANQGQGERQAPGAVSANLDGKLEWARREFKYEAAHNLMTQYFWASSAANGVGYAINSNPNLYSEDSEKKILGELVLARAIINMVTETTLLVANSVRWSTILMKPRLPTQLRAENPANLPPVLDASGSAPVPVPDASGSEVPGGSGGSNVSVNPPSTFQGFMPTDRSASSASDSTSTIRPSGSPAQSWRSRFVDMARNALALITRSRPQAPTNIPANIPFQVLQGVALGDVQLEEGRIINELNRVPIVPLNDDGQPRDPRTGPEIPLSPRAGISSGAHDDSHRMAHPLIRDANSQLVFFPLARPSNPSNPGPSNVYIQMLPEREFSDFDRPASDIPSSLELPGVSRSQLQNAPEPEIQVASGSGQNHAGEDPAVPPVALPEIDTPSGRRLGGAARAAIFFDIDYVKWNNRQQKVKITRNLIGGVGSAIFAANAVIAVGINAKLIDRARDIDTHGDEKAEKDKRILLASLGLSVASASLNVLVNGSKSLASFGSAPSEGWVQKQNLSTLGRTRWNKFWGRAGTGLGVLQAATGVAALAPYLFSDSLTGAEKTAVGFEMGMQAVGGGLMIASTILMERAAARGLAMSASLALGPMAAVVGGAVLISFSPIEMANIHKQFSYANDIEKIGKELSEGVNGYKGNEVLAQLYREKAGAELGIALGIAAVTIGSAIIAGAGILFGVGAFALLGVDLFAAVVPMVLRGAQQSMMEGIAKKYAEEIEKDSGFYRKNLQRQFEVLFDPANNPSQKEYLQNLQDSAHVDSVIVFASTQLTAQAMELAGITKTFRNFVTTATFFRRFDDGVAKGQVKAVDFGSGAKVVLDGAAGSTQLAAFVAPVFMPGTENREEGTTRVRNPRYADGTIDWLPEPEFLEVPIARILNVDYAPGNFTIEDGAASTTFDVRKMVAVVNPNNPGNFSSADLTIKGGAGNDVVIIGSSPLSFDGGEGYDTVVYDGLADPNDTPSTTRNGINGKTTVDVKPVGDTGRFEVTRTMSSIWGPVETKSAVMSMWGNRSMLVERRDMEIRSFGGEVRDILDGVEIIRGGNGGDHIRGNKADNVFEGGAGDDDLSGSGGNDVLMGGKGNDFIDGGAGNDWLVQGIESQEFSSYMGDSIDGGSDSDTLDFSTVGASGYIETDLADESVRTFAMGTNLKITNSAGQGGVKGRYIRIYHTNDEQLLSLSELRVYTDDGTDAAKLLLADSGGDVVGSGSSFSTERGALTNGTTGSSGETFSVKVTAKPYIELDLGFQRSIDSVSLWGDQVFPINSNNLRVFVSQNPFTSSPTAYADLTANLAIARGDVATVDTSDSGTVAGEQGISKPTTFAQLKVENIETLIGTSFNDIIRGDAQNNTLLGGAGEDTIEGRDGDDVLTGGAGSDTLAGGKDNDTFLQFMDHSGDDIDGGEGNNTLKYSFYQTEFDNIKIDLSEGKEEIVKTFRGTAIQVNEPGTEGPKVQYVRIYHTDAQLINAPLALTGLKIYVRNGDKVTDVAAGVKSSAGSDIPITSRSTMGWMWCRKMMRRSAASTPWPWAMPTSTSFGLPNPATTCRSES